MQSKKQRRDMKPARYISDSVRCAALAAIALCASGAQKQQALPTAATEQSKPSAAVTSPENAPGAALQERNPRYQLCKGDTFDLVFPLTPEFNQTGVIVQPDGYVTLTGIGDVHVAGETIPELRQTLQQAYGKSLHDPMINISLTDFQKPFFIASGQLAKPGKYEMRGDTTLTEGISIAGGFLESSKHSEVYLYRRVPTGWVEVKKVDVKKMLSAGNLAEDLHLQPGDMFYVPQNRMSKVKRYIPAPGVGVAINPATY